MSDVSETGLVACAFGMLFLLGALTCAIFLGTSQLVVHEPYLDRSSYFSTAGFFLLILSPLGGYLISYGLRAILRDSQRIDTDSGNE